MRKFLFFTLFSLSSSVYAIEGVFTFFADTPTENYSSYTTSVPVTISNLVVDGIFTQRNLLFLTVSLSQYSNGWSAVTASMKSNVLSTTPAPKYMGQDLIFQPVRGIVLGSTNDTAYQIVPNEDGSDIVLVPRIASPYHTDAQVKADIIAALATANSRKARIQALKADPDWISLTNQEAQFDQHFADLINALTYMSASNIKTNLIAIKNALGDNNARLNKTKRLLKDIITESR